MCTCDCGLCRYGPWHCKSCRYSALSPRDYQRVRATCGAAEHAPDIVRTSYEKVQCLTCMVAGFLLAEEEQERQAFPCIREPEVQNLDDDTLDAPLGPGIPVVPMWAQTPQAMLGQMTAPNPQTFTSQNLDGTVDGGTQINIPWSNQA